MKYKVSKISPMPGEFTDLTVKTLSSVKSPANQQTYLVMKGNNSEMPLTEIEKKELKEAGYSDEAIAKMSTAPTFGEKIAKFFGMGSQPTPAAPAPAASEAPITAETISKMFADFGKTIDEKLSVLKNNDSTPPVDDAAELARIQKEIDDEKAAQNETADIKKQLADKKAELEEVKKMRLPGNATSKANELPTGLSAEAVAKAQLEDIFKGSALSL